MKHPFWIVNSLLLMLFVFVLGFMYLSQTPLPEREHLVRAQIQAPFTKEKVEINIAKIYENDLFDTYKKETPTTELPLIIEPLPEPPRPQPITIPELPEPQFLEPLNIILKGIITVGSDNNHNCAIIEDSNTKQELPYRVGDTIDDARLIRILNNKIILLRTNGQQEVLYLREDDAKNDPAYTSTEQWSSIIEKTSDTDYTIDAQQFIQRVNNLGIVVDTLGLTTAYEQGMSIGCRIGQMDEKSFGPLLGLQKGDIILSVNGIPADSTDNRLAIYKHIIALSSGNTIAVTIQREDAQQILNYTLKAEDDTLKKSSSKQPSNETIQQQKHITTLKKTYSFAPTMKEIRTQEKTHMLNKGKARPGLSTNTHE